MSASRIERIAPFLSNPYLVLVLRLLLGGVLMFAGITKLPLHSEFIVVVKSYQLLPELLAVAYALLLPWAEFLLGVYLVLGILVKPSAFLSGLVGISLMVGNMSAIFSGKSYCGSCFGELLTLDIFLALAIDVLMVVVAIVLLMAGSEGALSFDGWFGRRGAADEGKSELAEEQ